MTDTNGQGLEFKLGEETYCVSIDSVTEIVQNQSAAGWFVDEIKRVVQVDYTDIDESPAADMEAIKDSSKMGQQLRHLD